MARNARAMLVSKALTSESNFMAKRIRLITGLILFAFLTSHLLNLSFGLISLEALDDSRLWFLFFWATKPGVALIMISVVTHLVLGLTALYNRNTLKMNRSDIVQLILGLVIFPLLFGHMLGVVIGPLMTGTRQTYFSILTLFWVLDPVIGLKQVIVTVITWIHGCMGLVIWMRIQAWWPRVAGFVYPLVIAIPLLALLGMVEAGKEVIELNKDPNVAAAALKILSATPDIFETLLMMQTMGLSGYFAILTIVLLARYVRVRKDRGVLNISYADGIRLDVKSGLTLLEISRMNNIPHASLCGGRGRCGTCRVRVHKGLNHLPEATERERKTLARVKAGSDTRLACQVIPGAGTISIERLLPAYIEPKDLRRARKSDGYETGDSLVAGGAE